MKFKSSTIEKRWRPENLAEKDVEIGIIGGTGAYDPVIFEAVKEIKVYTPYGKLSDLVSVGYLKGRKTAFIPRHGRRHQIPPHRINFRANIWALKELGVKRIWVTPKIPFIVALTAGFVLSVFIGNIFGAIFGLLG